MTIRVLLADDEPLVRAGISLILRGEAGLEVVGLADDGTHALEQSRALSPDVVLMDVRMPGMDGVEATRRILEDCVNPPAVLILSTFHVDAVVRGALRAGACGFVLKDAAPDELIAAVRAVADGEAWLDPAIAKGLLSEFKGRPDVVFPPHDALARLTPRELEVLVLMAHGLTNIAIGRHLVVAESTVKTHVNRILTKLGLHERAQAVATAYRSHLVAADDPFPAGVRTSHTGQRDKPSR
jgi:DNA-binding NarL/FixJ family response regulator